MNNKVVVIMNGRVTVNELYTDANAAHERYKELVRVSKKGKRDTDIITVYRMLDDYPMAFEEIIWKKSPRGLFFLFYHFITLVD